MGTISFAKRGAAPATPVQPVQPAASTPTQSVGTTTQPAPAAAAPAQAATSAPVQVVEPQPAPQNLPATVPTNTVAAPATGFYTGAEEDADVDARDIKLPRLNIVQGLSGPDLKAVGPEGTLAFKQAIALPQPARIVVAGFRPKKWAEKVRHGSEPRYANSLQEVYALGGTDEWRLSKENDQKGKGPVSNKPWFQTMVTGLILIQRPESLSDEHFTYVSEDGVAFAAALFTAKSTSYGAFYVPIQSERVTGSLRGGYCLRYIELTTRKGLKHPAFEPAVKFLEPTSDAVRKLALSLVS